jgi:hypothetical protein
MAHAGAPRLQRRDLRAAEHLHVPSSVLRGGGGGGVYYRYDAFGECGTIFRDLEWENLICSGSMVPKTPNRLRIYRRDS